MKKSTWIAVAVCLALILSSPAVFAQEGGGKKDKKRSKIDARSGEILDKALAESTNAKELYDKAISYAVFDNTKVALGVSGGGGSGVAGAKAATGAKSGAIKGRPGRCCGRHPGCRGQDDVPQRDGALCQHEEGPDGQRRRLGNEILEERPERLSGRAQG